MVAGWLRAFLNMTGKKEKETRRGWRLRGIIQKQGVGFPEIEKKWFGGPQHLNPHMDRLGLKSRKRFGTCSALNEGCMHVTLRGDLGFMILY